MNTIINLIQKSIEDICIKNNEIYRKRLDRIEAAYSETNEMIPPNEDRLGRLHAPCNGYRIPQKKLDFCDFNDYYEETLFSKGEFLPIPLPLNDEYLWCGNSKSNNFPFKDKMIVKNENIELLQALNDKDRPFTLGLGKTWKNGEDTVAYVYITSCWKSVVDVFRENLIEKKKAKPEPKGIAPIGEKITIKAKVIGIPLKRDYHDNPVFKLMLEFEDGATAFGSLPKKISDVEVGQHIEFKATFTASNSKSHSFYKSPSASKILVSETENELEVSK